MNWLKLAEYLDALRIIPRLILVAVYSYTLWYAWYFTEFYFKLIEKTDVTDWKLTAYSAFGALTIPAVTALAAKITAAYMDSGRKWSEP